MKKIIFICLFCLWSIHANAEDWSTADTWRESSWQVINVIDWGQTLDLDNCHSERCREMNPILGNYPSRGDINRYFLAAGFLHYGISKWLAPQWRQGFQYVSIGFSLNNVYANHHIGLRLNF